MFIFLSFLLCVCVHKTKQKIKTLIKKKFYVCCLIFKSIHLKIGTVSLYHAGTVVINVLDCFLN